MNNKKENVAHINIHMYTRPNTCFFYNLACKPKGLKLITNINK